jgi:hypothetical protein
MFCPILSPEKCGFDRARGGPFKRAELSMRGFGHPDVSRSAARSSGIGVVVALTAAIGIAALLTVISTDSSGVSASAGTQPPISITVNRRLKGDRLELSPSNLPADVDTSPETVLPKITPTPLESTPEPNIEITRQAGLRGDDEPRPS